MPLTSTAVSSCNDRQRRQEWRRWLGVVTLGMVVMVVTTTSVVLLNRHATTPNVLPSATLYVTSAPAGATVLVDGRQRGRTPMQLTVPPGDRRLTFQGSRVVPATVDVLAVARQVVEVRGTLWLRTPATELLRPPFPGASIATAGFLADGRVWLTAALPAGDERQLWVRPHDGGLQRLGPAIAPGAIVPSPDGGRVAYLAPSEIAAAAPSGFAPRLTAVRIASSDGQHDRQQFALDPGADDQLTDLSWSTDGSHLLLVIRRQQKDGGTRTLLRWLDVVQGSAPTLEELPSAVVPGRFLWSPRGDLVAFLTQAGPLVSLCLLGTAPPSFRYLADLETNDASPLSFPPVTWSADGTRLVYAAPVQDQATTLAGRLFGGRIGSALFATRMSDPTSRRLGTAEAGNPVWRADGSLLALARPTRSGPISADAIDARTGGAMALATLPVPPAAAYSVAWDATHGQALLAERTDGGSVAYWLLSFTPGVGR